jgi:hypothetical protein
MVYTAEEFHTLSQLIREGSTRELEFWRPEREPEQSAFDFLATVAQPGLLSVISDDLDYLVTSAASSGGRTLVDVHITVARQNALERQLSNPQEGINELFIEGLERRGVPNAAKTYPGFAPVFTEAILGLVGYYDWAPDFDSEI